jgi:hypothetical protein
MMIRIINTQDNTKSKNIKKIKKLNIREKHNPQ